VVESADVVGFEINSSNCEVADDTLEFEELTEEGIEFWVIWEFGFCSLKRPKVKSFYTENRTVLDNIKEFSYGFVDGDLYYVKKRRKVKMTAVFTEEDFKEFNDVKLLAWLSVYTDEDKRKQNKIDAFVLNQLTDEERKRYRRFLAENFDYKKYEQE